MEQLAATEEHIDERTPQDSIKETSRERFDRVATRRFDMVDDDLRKLGTLVKGGYGRGVNPELWAQGISRIEARIAVLKILGEEATSAHRA